MASPRAPAGVSTKTLAPVTPSIAGYILDAETVEDVHRALLQDATHALKLAFAGILERQHDGGYALGESFQWPEQYQMRIGPDAELARQIGRSRSFLTFSGKESALIRDLLPRDQLTFAAPLFFDRTVSGIVVYGNNVSGLDLDPDEREHLARVVAHASIALSAIESPDTATPPAKPRRSARLATPPDTAYAEPTRRLAAAGRKRDGFGARRERRTH